MDCFKRYWAWTQDRRLQEADDARSCRRPISSSDNYLSTDAAHSGDAAADQRLQSRSPPTRFADNIWDNFSSQSYKTLPSVGTITFFDPFTGEPLPYQMPAGGRGYTRVPSLISLWSTAPLLLNNTVGPFDQTHRWKRRMAAFNQVDRADAVAGEDARRTPLLGGKIPGIIDRTTERSFVYIPLTYLPDSLQRPATWTSRLLPWLVSIGRHIAIGPIPAGHAGKSACQHSSSAAEADDNVAEHAANLARLGWSAGAQFSRCGRRR